MTRYPAPLGPGDRVGVTSTSAGVKEPLRPRLDAAVAWLEARGYEVVLGDCMDGEPVTSAASINRARELTRMLTDPTIRAVIPPWGGELAIEILPHLDFAAIASAEPTWLIGYFGTAHAEAGLIIYLEAAESPALDIARALWGLRLAGWFEHAVAVLIGRTQAPASRDFSQRDAVISALADLDIPIVLDVDCGHVPPRLCLINGANARLVVDEDEQSITQALTYCSLSGSMLRADGLR